MALKTNATFGANAIWRFPLASGESGGDFLEKVTHCMPHIADIKTRTPGCYSMPVPMMNIIMAASNADNKTLNIQEIYDFSRGAPKLVSKLR